MTIENITIGDQVPYKNTASKIAYAKITHWQNVGLTNGKQWFWGVDTKTGAKVYYPLHKTISLMQNTDDKN